MLGNILGSIASSVLSGGNGNQSTALQLIQSVTTISRWRWRRNR